MAEETLVRVRLAFGYAWSAAFPALLAFEEQRRFQKSVEEPKKNIMVTAGTMVE